MLQLDGSIGEGGGQILRTALSLSLLTGKPFHLSNIRAGRKKPGLMRQHLVCVQAAKAIGHATVVGDHLHSTELTFTPHTVQAGHYHFPIGSAGSTMLVLQTLLPVLMMQDQPSTFKIEGGTHNPMAPTLDFVQRSFLPALAKIGVQAEVFSEQVGFFPVGGGLINVTIQPWVDRKPLSLLDRGALRESNAYAGVLNLDGHIVERELAVLDQMLTLSNQGYLHLSGRGQGNTAFVEVVSKHHTEVFTALGEMGRTAEQVAKKLANEVKRYLMATCAVDEHLADQLLLPLALGVGGEFSCREITDHTRTQALMIETFLTAKIRIEEGEQRDYYVVRVEV
ncbi:RNA 3'-terminal phosphate cyclase [Aquirhabdus parva]|uniref:RNA 3'-terminal phosphate cyclase n=1 Tax=Aquirhabdus parva TaxID=2283318 RepID=A0A345PA37_9GAMM|nr:RNA 3'-terminal phosphate cyclase [Aquirhabdus parva]AXI04146.1 RNA 3'-terminal phosphate cyclase [Aquirhabdus parva]